MKNSKIKVFFLLSFAIISWNSAIAQTSGLCDRWSIEVCGTQLQSPTDPSPCVDNCNRVYYYFYLVDNDPPQGTTAITESRLFTFKSLSIVGSLDITQNLLLLVGAKLSKMNEKASIECSPVFPGLNNPGIPNSPILNFDGDNFSYEVSSNDPLSPILNWSVFGRTLLFTLAVDVFPDESVTLEDISWSATLHVNNADLPCPVGIVNQCTPSLSKVINQPTNTCIDYTNGVPLIRFGQAINSPATGYPQRKKIPVFLSGNGDGDKFMFNEIDFLARAKIITGNSMQTPTIESGIIPAQSVFTYPYVNSSINQTCGIYVHHYDPLEIPNFLTQTDENTLFYIVINGPELESECISVEISFPAFSQPFPPIAFGPYGRISELVNGNLSCCRPGFGSNTTVEWIGNDCPVTYCQDLQLTAEPNINLTPSNCNGVLCFDIKASSLSSNFFTMQDLRFSLLVNKVGTFTHNTSSSNPLFCSTCVTVTDLSADLMRIDVTLNALNLTVGQFSTINLGALCLSTPGGCISGMTFIDGIVYRQNVAPCIPSVLSLFDNNNVDDDVCAGGQVVIKAETINNNPIEDWAYYVNRFPTITYPNNCKPEGGTNAASASVCACALNETEQNVALYKNNDPLNGVSTFDLVLINQHILGINPINDGFKLIAADVQQSSNVTATDIIDIRKLILGLNSEFPDKKSWRFFDKDYADDIQQNSSNPFTLPGVAPVVEYNIDISGNGIATPIKFSSEEFDEFVTVSAQNQDLLAEFVGVKLGDVNGNSIPNLWNNQHVDRSNAVVSLGMNPVKGKKGVTMDIPVFGIADFESSAWQLALQYNPDLLKINDVRWAVPITDPASQMHDWNIVKPGEVRLLGFDALKNTSVPQGSALFYLNVTFLKSQEGHAPLFTIAETGSIPSLSWHNNGPEFALQLGISDIKPRPAQVQTTDSKPNFCSLDVYPNPSNGLYRLNIESSANTDAKLQICNLQGQLIHEKSVKLTEGLNYFHSREFPQLIPGQYLVKLNTSDIFVTAKVVIQ